MSAYGCSGAAETWSPLTTTHGRCLALRPVPSRSLESRSLASSSVQTCPRRSTRPARKDSLILAGIVGQSLPVDPGPSRCKLRHESLVTLGSLRHVQRPVEVTGTLQHGPQPRNVYAKTACKTSGLLLFAHRQRLPRPAGPRGHLHGLGTVRLALPARSTDRIPENADGLQVHRVKGLHQPHGCVAAAGPMIQHGPQDPGRVGRGERANRPAAGCALFWPAPSRELPTAGRRAGRPSHRGTSSAPPRPLLGRRQGPCLR